MEAGRSTDFDRCEEMRVALEGATEEALKRATTEASAIWAEYLALGEQIEALKRKRSELFDQYGQADLRVSKINRRRYHMRLAV